MKYKIGDISKITQISSSGLRFYEQIGIIFPGRCDNKKYRNFDQRELDAIFAYKIFRNDGFSQKESIELLNDVSPEELEEKLEARQEAIYLEIKEKQILSGFIGRQIQQIHRSRINPQDCQIERNPTLLRIKLWQPDSREGEFVPFSLLSEWYEKIPFVDACFKYSCDDILNNAEILYPDFGVAIEEEDAVALGFSPKSKIDLIPSQLCIHTFVESTADNTILGRQLDHVRAFIDQNRLKITGCAFNRRVYNVFYKTKNLRLDHLWIPLQDG
jgi:DNA-binding transcriptional MerR regulator